MAPPGTRLYKRLKNENRLLPGGTGDNTDGSTNFMPKMGREILARGYEHIVSTIYSPKHYYERIKIFLKEYQPKSKRKGYLDSHHLAALIKSMWFLGIKEKGRWYYWRLFVWALLKKPKSFPLSITFAVQGLHFRKVAEKIHIPPIRDIHELEQTRT
jgi:hypothetical protein